jgi:hypothetical protein
MEREMRGEGRWKGREDKRHKKLEKVTDTKESKKKRSKGIF